MEQALEPLLDPPRDCDATVLERSFVPSSWNDATAFLHNRLPSSGDSDDDQFLKTISRDEEMIAFLGPYHHIEGIEVLDNTCIRDEPVSESLEAQDDAPGPCHHLIWAISNSVEDRGHSLSRGTSAPRPVSEGGGISHYP